jgi:hypothetical protein
VNPNRNPRAVNFPNIAINSNTFQNREFRLWFQRINDYKTNRSGVCRVDAKRSAAFMQGYAERGFLQ